MNECILIGEKGQRKEGSKGRTEERDSGHFGPAQSTGQTTYGVHSRAAHEKAARRARTPHHTLACVLRAVEHLPRRLAAACAGDVLDGLCPRVAHLCAKVYTVCWHSLGLPQLAHVGHGVPLLHRQQLALSSQSRS